MSRGFISPRSWNILFCRSQPWTLKRRVFSLRNGTSDPCYWELTVFTVCKCFWWCYWGWFFFSVIINLYLTLIPKVCGKQCFVVVLNRKPCLIHWCTNTRIKKKQHRNDIWTLWFINEISALFLSYFKSRAVKGLRDICVTLKLTICNSLPSH